MAATEASVQPALLEKGAAGKNTKGTIEQSC
jgi:hypothetical protein